MELKLTFLPLRFVYLFIDIVAIIALSFYLTGAGATDQIGTKKGGFTKLTTEQNKVLVWGINQYTDRVINYSQKIGLKVIYIVTDSPADKKLYNGIQILSAQDERNIDPNIPVILTDIEPGDRNTLIQTIKHINEGSKRRVFHPAAFYDFYTSPRINKVGLFGLPGSGNMIVQTIFSDILSMASLDPTEVDLKWFMSCYHNFLVQFIESELNVKHHVTPPTPTLFFPLIFFFLF